MTVFVKIMVYDAIVSKWQKALTFGTDKQKLEMWLHFLVRRRGYERVRETFE